MWQYQLHPPHLISVATLPRETQNTENVILQQDITKQNCIRWSQLHQSGPGSSCALNLLILGVIQQCVYETIHDVEDVRKRMMQTWLAFDQDFIDVTTDQCRDRLRSCVHAGGGHIEHMLWNEHSFIWSIRTFYEAVSVLCM